MATTPPPASRPRLSQDFSDHGHELVAVDDVALLVHDHHAVGVAVERNPDIGPHLVDFADQLLGRGRAAILVDIQAVRIDADLDHLGAQLPQGLRRDLVAGAVRAIDHDPDAVEADVLRQRALGELHIALACAVDAGRAADLLGGRKKLGRVASHQRLDFGLGLVGKLVAVRPEQLDAVVHVGVVGGRDHHAEIGAQRAGQHGDGRRRHRPELEHVHAHRGEARDERGFDHVAGQPRVLADHDAMPVRAIGEELASGHADAERHLRRHRKGVGAATDAVRAEILASHVEAPRIFPLERRTGGLL